MNRFGAAKQHDPHMLYTLSALQILALCNRLDLVSDPDLVAGFIASLQLPDGSFTGDKWGEVDTRFTYCAFSALSIIGKLRSGVINLAKGIEFIGRYLYIYIYS